MKRKGFILLMVCTMLVCLVLPVANAFIKNGWDIRPLSQFSRNGPTCQEDAQCFVCGAVDPNAYNYHYSRARVIRENELTIISDSGRCYDNGSQTSYATATAQNAAIYSGRAYWGDVY